MATQRGLVLVIATVLGAQQLVRCQTSQQAPGPGPLSVGDFSLTSVFDCNVLPTDQTWQSAANPDIWYVITSNFYGGNEKDIIALNVTSCTHLVGSRALTISHRLHFAWYCRRDGEISLTIWPSDLTAASVQPPGPHFAGGLLVVFFLFGSW